jgi:hypothetical protein
VQLHGRCVSITHPRLCLCVAAPTEDGYSEPFTANSTGVQFYVNTTYGPFAEAEENCQYNGGHVATYTSASEQVGKEARCRGCCHQLVHTLMA